MALQAGGQSVKRTPLKRRTRLRSRRDPVVTRLDALWREVIHARDQVCQRTGQSQHLQCAHVRSRRYFSTRWHPSNGVLLTAGQHLWAHHNPTAFSAWWKEAFPDRAQWLELQNGRGAKIDRKLIELSLREELRKLTEAAR